VSGLTANNKVYDGHHDRDAEHRQCGARRGGEWGHGDVEQRWCHRSRFANKNVGTNKTVTISGLTISGTDSANYTLTQPTTTANITAASLTVSATA